MSVATRDVPRPHAPVTASAGDRLRALAPWLLAGIVLVSVAATGLAMRRTSATFDEIVWLAGGARGWETGQFDLAPDHPPLLQYVYGLPVHLAGPELPDESTVDPTWVGTMGYRYLYARAFLWGGANDAERLILLARLPALLAVAALVLLAFSFARRWGVHAGLIAAALVAFLPDVLAHGGVAYGDLPMAVALLGGIWAADHAVRSLRPRDAALAGAVIAVALCIKATAVVLVPIGVVLLAIEAWLRRGDPAWRRRLPLAFGAAALAAYFVLVLVARGDPLLTELRYGLSYRFHHVASGHRAAAFLLGERSTVGWWYFFPVAFLFKTSAALHLLVVLAAVQLARELSASPRRALASPLRAPVIGLAIFGAALLASRLNIGFRYALPGLPLLAVITAVGVARMLPNASRMVRAGIFAALVWSAAFPLSYYPHFLGFISEYGPGRGRNHEVLVDSSLDWGQGLVALREWMATNGIPRVHLSYFGSAEPRGYGIDYLPLPSFFELPPAPPSSGPDPEWVVISATNLAGAYLPADPFAHFREREPDAVLAHSLLAFRLRPEGE